MGFRDMSHLVGVVNFGTRDGKIVMKDYNFLDGYEYTLFAVRFTCR